VGASNSNWVATGNVVVTPDSTSPATRYRFRPLTAASVLFLKDKRQVRMQHYLLISSHSYF